MVGFSRAKCCPHHRSMFVGFSVRYWRAGGVFVSYNINNLDDDDTDLVAFPVGDIFSTEGALLGDSFVRRGRAG